MPIVSKLTLACELFDHSKKAKSLFFSSHFPWKISDKNTQISTFKAHRSRSNTRDGMAIQLFPSPSVCSKTHVSATSNESCPATTTEKTVSETSLTINVLEHHLYTVDQVLKSHVSTTTLTVDQLLKILFSTSTFFFCGETTRSVR